MARAARSSGRTEASPAIATPVASSRDAASSRPCCAPLPDADDSARLAKVLRALGDPTRLRMLALMAHGRACCDLPAPAERGVPGAGEPHGICVCELQEQFGLAQSRTSYHLRVLRQAGLVREETRGKWSFYAPDRETLRQALARLGAALDL